MTKLLHKYWKTAAMAASSYVGDSPLFLIDYLLRLLRVIVLLSIWRTILAGKGTVSGMTLEAVLTYTLVAEVFAAQLSPRTTLDEVFWNGTIASRLLQPLGIFGQFSAEMFGRWLFEFSMFSVPLLLFAPLLGVSALPADAGAAGLFVISLALAISVGLAIEFVFGGLLVVLQLPHWAVSQVRSAITTLLSGAIVPLALLPQGIGAAFAWMPFASMASAPLKIYTGTGEPIGLLALQVGWSLVLWPLAHWLWRASRERMVAYGG
jgi:ABC-2 type transport system permease protein